MASNSKKAKTSKRNHPGRDGKFLKKEPKVRKLTFYTATERKKLNAEIKQSEQFPSDFHFDMMFSQINH